MKYLLDTGVWLRAVNRAHTIPTRVLRVLQAPQEIFGLAAISLWEVGKKVQAGKLSLPKDLAAWFAGAVASNLDSAIEDNFKAAIKAHENLNDQSIHASAKNGTLVIKGSVKTAAQKKEVSTLAKQVPNVQQVVNELEVKPGKHSTPTS